MKKILNFKNNILFFILGAITFSGIGAVVATSLASSDIAYTTSKNANVTNVKQAVDDLYEKTRFTVGTAVYYNPATNTKCTKAEADANVNSYGTPTGIDSGCMKWYIITNSYEKNYVSMILDHNTVATSYWDSTNGVNYIMKEPVDILNNLTSRTENKWQVPARLITAQEIFDITGNMHWRDGFGDAWYWLDTNNRGTHSSFNENNRSKYAWLFDWTYDCKSKMDCSSVGCNEDWGCNYEDNNKYNNYNIWGYWTSTPLLAGNQYHYAYTIANSGAVVYYTVYDNVAYGIRPVVTILKSILIS